MDSCFRRNDIKKGFSTVSTIGLTSIRQLADELT
jgi:hypothetical protein